MARTLEDLRQKQALPLEVKILLTRERIRQWIDEYGEDGVYVSFSGGNGLMNMEKTAYLFLFQEERIRQYYLTLYEINLAIKVFQLVL